MKDHYFSGDWIMDEILNSSNTPVPLDIWLRAVVIFVVLAALLCLAAWMSGCLRKPKNDDKDEGDLG